MNPIYKFTLSINGATPGQAYPVYSEDLEKVYQRESGEEFFRATLNGSLIFVGADYTTIISAQFDAKFEVVLYISYDNGSTWAEYWKGRFWKTDCTINEDDRSIEVTPNVVDEYTDILDGMEKEYDLIKLAPSIEELTLDKRGMTQIYTPGESVVACFLSGMWWEEECSPQEDTSILIQTGDGKPNFKKMTTLRFARITNRSDIPDGFYAKFTATNIDYQCSADGYIFKYTFAIATPYQETWEIIRASDNTTLWRYTTQVQIPTDISPIELSPVDSSVRGNVIVEFSDAEILARYICDVDMIGSQPTYELPYDDFVFDNRNYKRVVQYNIPESISVSTNLTDTPTRWGIYQPGTYYLEPTSLYGQEFFPISRTYWGRCSLWYHFPSSEHQYEVQSRKEIKLKNAYPLHSAIKALLGQIAPNIDHKGTTAYSQFLYGQNPLTSDTIYWFVTPKSNILVGEYDQPAQKAPVTLREVFDMLRDVFRCYWYIDDGKLKIEHVSFFMKGGSYSVPAQIGRDLTTEFLLRNGKRWSYCTSKYSFDKGQMPSRYEFGWMDAATQYFEGEPIDIVSNYVEKEKVEKINVQSFSSDVDYLMLEPSKASSDGFVLLGAIIPPQENIVTSTTANKVLLITGAVATDVNYCVSGYIAVNGKNIKGNIPSVPYQSSLYCDYCVYDENQNPIRYGRGSIYYYQSGDAYVRFTLKPSSPTATYYYFVLPYFNYQVGINDHWLQNGLAAFIYLERFYLYDLPAKYYSIGGAQGTALGIKKGKIQSLQFPCLDDPDLVELVKTNLGNGKIQKISINLSSRNGKATLMYDTE